MPKKSAGGSKDGMPADGDAADWKRRIGRQRERRLGTDELWRTLDVLVTDAGQEGKSRSQALKSGRTRTELLEAVIAKTRKKLMAPAVLQQACTTQAMTPGALQEAYTTQSGAGLLAIELKSGSVAHQSLSFQDLTSWIPAEARGNIRVCLDSRDGDDFHRFCQSVVRDAGEPWGETFLGRDNVVGRSITVRFFTRPPGPRGSRNPEWLLMVRKVKLTLQGVQQRQLGELPAAGMRLPFWGLARIPEAIGVFTADLSGGTPSQWTVQAAHVRNLLDVEVAPGTYDMDSGTMNPLQQLAMFFSFGGNSVFSRAGAQLEYAATSALNIAQRSASWLTRKALRTTHQWSMRLHHDDSTEITFLAHATLFGGVSTSVSMDAVGGRVRFSHGGLDVLYFIADPEQPLDGNLRATATRIASSSLAGEFDVQRPFVMSCEWGGGKFQLSCKMLSFDTVGKRMASEEDVSQLLERLKVSPGVGLLSDGSATICVGKSHV